MIIRKPYAFLIKHYKLINLLLLIPMFYIALKFGDISKFFSEYIGAKYSTPETVIAGKYITALTYLVLIFLIIYNLLLYVLMKSKKKPTIDYIAGSIYYILLLVLSLFFFNTMKDIELRKATDALALMARDISLIAVLPSYVMLFLTLLKGVGFNLKTFRFDGNLDLQITEDDDAEVELKIGADGYVAKRTIVHTLRELKYYVLENKFVFTCIGAVLIVTILTSLYMSIGLYNKKFNINQAFALDSFTFTVKDSYITNVDYTGEVIDDYYYLVVKVEVLNRSRNSEKLYEENFKVFKNNNTYFVPSFDRSNRFLDLGNAYNGEPIPAEKKDTYVFAYKINKKDIQKTYQLKVLSSIAEKNGKLIPQYRVIKIKPQDLTKTLDLQSIKMGNEVTLDKTTLGKTKLKVNNITFVKTYSWDYTNANGAKRKDLVTAKSGKILMVIEDSIKYDETTSYYLNTTRDFYGDFGTLNFNYENNSVKKPYTSSLKNVTPASLKGVKIYEVSGLAEKGTNRELELNIRNVKINVVID